MDAKLRDADKIGGKIDSVLNAAEKALNDLEPAKAEELLKEASQLLKEPDLEISPERDMYSSRRDELQPRLAQVKEQRLARDIEEAVRSERAEIGPSLQAMKDNAEAMAGPKVDDKKLDALKDSITTVEKALNASDDRRTFASKDPSFGSYLKRAKAEVDKAKAEVGKGEKKVKFVAGPGALKTAAADGLKQAKTERDAEKKRTLMVDASKAYAKCASSGAEFAAIKSEKIFAAGSTTTVEAFIESCKAAQDTTDKAIAKLPKPKPAKKKK